MFTTYQLPTGSHSQQFFHLNERMVKTKKKEFFKFNVFFFNCVFWKQNPLMLSYYAK